MDAIKDKKTYEKTYNKTIESYNEVCKEYNEKVPRLLDSMEEHIRESVIIQADCLRKLIVC